MKNNPLLKTTLHLDEKGWENWLLLRFSSFFKNKYRLDFSEIELIESYRLALEQIYKAIKNEPLLCNPKLYSKNTEETAPIQIFKTYSLGIPFMFLTRHLLELSMKRFLERDTGTPTKSGHNIDTLWKSCVEIRPTELRKYTDLIDCLSILDRDELHFRYVKSPSGNPYDNSPVFIDYRKIYHQAILLSKILVPDKIIS